MKKDFTLRALQAIQTLSRPHGATIEELRARLEYTSSKSIYNIIEKLRELGYKVESRPDPDGPTSQKKWYIKNAEPKWFQKEMYGLTGTERLLISLSLQHLKLFRNSDLAEDIEKLRLKLRGWAADSREDDKHDVYVLLKQKKSLQHLRNHIPFLLSAIRDRKVCTVAYAEHEMEDLRTFDIHPLTLTEYDNDLYLTAAIPETNREIRVLDLDRIVSLQESNGFFRIPAGYNPRRHFASSFGIGTGELAEYKILFKKSAAPQVRNRNWGKDQSIEDREDGSIRLCFYASGRQEIKRWILGFGPDAIVMKPEDLRREIEEDLRKTLETYDSAGSV